MSDRTIDTYSDLAALSAAARQALIDLITSTVAERGVFRIALAGGSTPKRLYELLATAEIPWAQLQLFWGDERNVPPDHAESNYRMVREALLDPAQVPAASVCPPPINVASPEQTALAYESRLREAFGDEPFPRWDLALQGMGDDAHTASLFPETAALEETERWFVANWVPKFDAYRLTLTAPAICSARNIWFLVAGEKKREALRHVWEGPHNPSRYPSQSIEPRAGSLRWFLTEDADPRPRPS